MNKHTRTFGVAMAIVMLTVLLVAPSVNAGSSSASISVNVEIIDNEVLVNQKVIDRSDFNKDGEVNEADLNRLLEAWGKCTINRDSEKVRARCVEDLDFNGKVGTSDLAILLRSWTPETNPQIVSGLTSKEIQRLRGAEIEARKVFGFPTVDRSQLGKSSIVSKAATTSNEIAEVIDIAPEIVEQDIEIIQPSLSDTSTITFPARILIFKAVADSEEIGLVRGYIGSLKQARIIDDGVEIGDITYSGRIVLEIIGQEQVESYLVKDGNEEDFSYSLVSVEDDLVQSSEPTAKLLIRPEEKMAIMTFADDGSIINMKIISLERRALRPDSSRAANARGELIPDISGNTNSQEMITNKRDKSDIEITESQATNENLFQDQEIKQQKKNLLVSWFNNLFGINSEAEEIITEEEVQAQTLSRA